MKACFSDITNTKLIYMSLSYQQALKGIKLDKYSLKKCTLETI